MPDSVQNGQNEEQKNRSCFHKSGKSGREFRTCVQPCCFMTVVVIKKKTLFFDMIRRGRKHSVAIPLQQAALATLILIMRLNKILDISHMALIGDLDLAIAIAVMAGMRYIGDDAARIIQDAVVGIQPYNDRTLL